jgi:SpoVK/Ycf46/Vps4 family AAA+-type ATPase
MTDLRGAGAAARVSPVTASKFTKAASSARGAGGIVLFKGPRGKGQAAAAEKIAADAGVKMQQVDASRLKTKYAAEAERELQRVFSAAEQKGWILFFDEADALFGSRTDVKDSHDRYANTETSYVLGRLEKYRGLVILATNKPATIPPRIRKKYLTLIDFPLR